MNDTLPDRFLARLQPGVTAENFLSAGLTRCGLIRTADLVFDDSVRTICERNQCRRYGSTWACPPGAGSIADCRQRLLAYDHALVFSCVYPLEDSLDIEGMQAASEEFKKVCDRLHAMVQPPFLMLGNGGCRRCPTCTYPNAPCRHPELLIHSLSGYCIIASQMAASADIPYIAGENTVSYFGLIAF